MVEVRFACIPSVEGVKCTLDGVVKYSDEIGICSFFGVSQGAHTYSVEKAGMRLVEGEDAFGRKLGARGTTVIEWALIPGTPWPEAQPWIMLLTFEAGAPQVPSEASEIIGKAGAVLSSLGLAWVFIDSARRG